MSPEARNEFAPVSIDEAAPLLEPYLSGSAGLILAVSGGPDSVALMRLTARLRHRMRGGPVVVATVDHGLRPESRREAEAVAGWATECGLAHRILTWEAEKPGTRVQEAARDARYGLLADAARAIGAVYVVTAHTLDDQAETVIMRMARGTGIGGLGGMRREVERDSIVLARPFLALRKARLVARCHAEGWPYLDDPSNADLRFVRARLRGRLMPLLAEEGVTPERLAALALRARRTDHALALRAAAVLAIARRSSEEDRMEFDAAPLLDEPEAIFLRVIAQAIDAVAGARARPVRLERFERHILGELRPALGAGAPLRFTLAGCLIEARENRRLVLTPEPPRRSRGA